MRSSRILVVAALALAIAAVFAYFGYAMTTGQSTVENKTASMAVVQKNNKSDGDEFTIAKSSQSSEKVNLLQADKEETPAVEGKNEAASSKVQDAAVKEPVKAAEVTSRGAQSKDVYLQEGAQGRKVTDLQKKLKVLGFFRVIPTGYYGSITVDTVKRFQKRYDQVPDGVVHDSTMSLINRLVKENSAKETSKTLSAASVKSKTAAASGSGKKSVNYLIPWFDGVESIFNRGETATVYDIQTGLSFKIMRTYGRNHADCETLTSADTKIMKQIYGGQLSWERRPVIIIEDGRRIAASMAGMPHAGLDSEPANVTVDNRSTGYGTGTNLDTIKGNNMDGHFDIHFLGSRTHGTNSVNEAHQNAVKKAAAWAEANY